MSLRYYLKDDKDFVDTSRKISNISSLINIFIPFISFWSQECSELFLPAMRLLARFITCRSLLLYKLPIFLLKNSQFFGHKLPIFHSKAPIFFSQKLPFFHFLLKSSQFFPVRSSQFFHSKPTNFSVGSSQFFSQKLPICKSEAPNFSLKSSRFFSQKFPMF